MAKNIAFLSASPMSYDVTLSGEEGPIETYRDRATLQGV